MPLCLTCSCGARLEIDDKFAGQVINCPDCHKQIETKPPPAKPRKTSGWAIAGLLLALIGVFTVIGPLLAILAGWVSLRQQTRHPDRVGGQKYARAAIILGGLFTLLGLAALWSPNILGVDGLLREIEWAGKLEYPAELQFAKESFSITRANSSWGVMRHTGRHTDIEPGPSDDVIFVRPAPDAQVACMTVDLLGRDEPPLAKNDPAEKDPDIDLEWAKQQFLASELVAVVGKIPAGRKPKLDLEKVRDKKKVESPKGTLVQEMTVDLTLDGRPRTFLIRVIRVENLHRLNVVAAGTRRHNFTRLEPELHKIVESYKSER